VVCYVCQIMPAESENEEPSRASRAFRLEYTLKVLEEMFAVRSQLAEASADKLIAAARKQAKRVGELAALAKAYVLCWDRAHSVPIFLAADAIRCMRDEERLFYDRRLQKFEVVARVAEDLGRDLPKDTPELAIFASQTRAIRDDLASMATETSDLDLYADHLLKLGNYTDAVQTVWKDLVFSLLPEGGFDTDRKIAKIVDPNFASNPNQSTKTLRTQKSRARRSSPKE
jgi:hypothetical protein